MDLGLLTHIKCFQKRANRSLPTFYATPFKARVFEPRRAFRDKYASFDPQNSEFLGQSDRFLYIGGRHNLMINRFASL